MPLKDHFHPPLSKLRHWESFHSRWASVIADTLDGTVLPEGYFAEVQVHLGGQVEVDIAAFEDGSGSGGNEPSHAASATALASAPTAVWAPPKADFTLPADFPDRLEILVFASEGGPTLVAAIELLSPRNKDRSQSRQAFAAKCAAYLQQGVGLIVIDVVSSRHANLHNVLMHMLELGDQGYLLDEKSLYAIAYRPVVVGERPRVDVWHHRLDVGGPLPTLPLPLDKGRCVRLDVEATYEEACARSRLPD